MSHRDVENSLTSAMYVASGPEIISLPIFEGQDCDEDTREVFRGNRMKRIRRWADRLTENLKIAFPRRLFYQLELRSESLFYGARMGSQSPV